MASTERSGGYTVFGNGGAGFGELTDDTTAEGQDKVNVYYAMLIASGDELTLNLGLAEAADTSVVFVVGDERFSIADAALRSGSGIYHYAWTVTDMGMGRRRHDRDRVGRYRTRGHRSAIHRRDEVNIHITGMEYLPTVVCGGRGVVVQDIGKV